MNSSISASEPPDWRPTLRFFAVAAALLGTAVAAALVAFDPYDTGRFAVVTGYGVPVVGQSLAAASLAREPDASGALIGNSTIQLVDPARLSASVGTRFVSLAVAGSGPTEQLVIADWYLRHHRGGPAQPVRALVFGLDQSWCQSDGRLDVTNPFPFWLYSRNAARYIANLLRLKTFEIAERKFKVVIGRDRPLRADGYRDYDSGHAGEGLLPEALALSADAGALPARIDFAAVPRLRAFLGDLPPEAAVVLLFPPRHLNGLPAPGSGAAALFDRCKAAYRTVAATRRRTAVVDLAVDGEIARDDGLFRDRIHYRQPVARVVEDAVAGAIASAASVRH